MAAYAHPEVLVSTDWVAEHLDDTEHVRIVESDEDVLLYETGHIPNAVKIDWVQDLQDPIVRDYISKEKFEELCASRGIANDTLVVFYGDKNNWWACYAFWVFKLFGHEKCAIMDGGRQKWIAEGRPLTREVPSFPRTTYRAKAPDPSIRAFREEVLAHMRAGKPLIDVRTPAEYRGELTHMPDYPQEGALRAGHIPGAKNVPWSMAIREDGTFKPREELERIYLQEKGLKPDDEVITYCRIGERSSHTWFVLKYLLGFEHVKNYDGSWTEWGNLVGVPIEKGDPEAARS
ncbi:Thiosulfate sulfurtransferase [Rhodothermus marinus SG0.5JP17-172]|jgi:thiosulfate/3-mercaptopyruvate sulfurtransferase|uniref:sulfurtransferase n=1 Tax=Rhodothermus marinus TaxID=29549 RepID=UPI000223D696|nr:sulfurtransferase [Rhodothermus marinus]AEN73797.1 Thiosulfate sulfurtransferase [Rhodothermus marinus SG0.5JP17-172]MBO2491582.1 sulfurtransferase [Rhodothermus marinus]